PEEAAVLAGVAGAPAFLLDDEEQRVAVAVVVGLAEPLSVTGGVALAPELGAAPAPEHGAALLEGAAQRGLVHPRQHEDLPGLVLDDRGDQPVAVPVDLGEVVVADRDRCRGGRHRVERTSRLARLRAGMSDARDCPADARVPAGATRAASSDGVASRRRRARRRLVLAARPRR